MGIMARRKTATRRRRSRSFSILNAVESYTYASILSKGAFGYSNPLQMIRGDADITDVTAGSIQSSFGQGIYVGGSGANRRTYEVATGTNLISLGDIMANPSAALAVASINVQSNIVPMMLSSAATSISFRLGKRLLRKPLNSVNRSMKMALGAGIKF